MDMACCLYLAAVTFSFFIFLDQSKLLMSVVFALCGIQHIVGLASRGAAAQGVTVKPTGCGFDSHSRR